MNRCDSEMRSTSMAIASTACSIRLSCSDDAAATAGDPELAQQWIDDGDAQLGVAADSYGTASDYADTAASSYGAAGDDLSLVSDDASTADSPSYATDADSPSYATDADS